MKYKVKQYILRAVPLILLCCMFIFILSPSASAVDYLNYRDFEVDVQVDGNNDIVKCVVPSSLCTVGIRNELWQVVAESKGSLSYDVSANQKYYIYFWPLPAILSLHNIPDTTEFYFMIRADVSNNAFSTPSCEMIYDYYEGDKSVKIVSTPYGEVSFPFTFAFDGVISKPSSLVDGLGFSLWLREFVPFSDSTLDLTAYDFQLTFTISSLYRMQELTGETNELLDEVNRQLEEQGKTMDDVLNQQTQTNDKLDDIINGEVNPEAPDGSDKVGDLDDAEGQLRDEAQVGLDQGVEIQQSVLQILEEYANGFAVFSWLFGLFAKLPFFSGLLYVSVALGTVSALLNLGLSAQSASHRSQRRKKGG